MVLFFIQIVNSNFHRVNNKFLEDMNCQEKNSSLLH